MIIDSQVHIWGPNTPERPWVPGLVPQMPEPLTAERLSAVMTEAGVNRAVLVPPVLESDRNDLCLAAAQKWPDRFAVMGRVLVEQPDAPAKFEQMLAQKGMLGFRLSFLRDFARKILSEGKADWFWQAAERRGVPVMMFAPGLLAEAGQIARAHPGLNLILDHMAMSGAMRGGAQIAEAVKGLLELAPLPNVSVKLSALPCYSVEDYPFRDMHEPIQRVIEAFGRTRCFWGTDYSRLPANCTYRQAVTMFTEEIPFLSDDDLEWIMGRGLAEKIGWPIAG
jgi:predicted TIM-barrel fold metal-dependent hydrolase